MTSVRTPSSLSEKERGGADPVARFERLFAEAQQRREPLPEAMVLATSARNGRASARFVLLKQVDRRGFLFFTDARSRKGEELRKNAFAAAVFYWHRTNKQVRIEGRVERASDAEADAYWESRPRSSRLAGLASRQSAEIFSRRELLTTVRRLRRTLRGRPVPRPRSWVGFRIIADRIEIWYRRVHRLHHRELFLRHGDRWERRLLQP
ncbi:MAG TPA: pyridoxamine 5'-phosphate oxidase [Candidatus Binatia bacterium]|nr:pyridoxamine 5'-phosphate oxidase [Candidatus Binatia bacterium]